MKKILFLLLLCPLSLCAQKKVKEANALLDKVVAAIKADAPVKMDYTYSVFDDEEELVQDDKGVIYVDGNRYALLMENMKVWCDGSTQWSYMRDINEIYVTEASSDEAQNLSPLYIMEHYREGYDVSMAEKGGNVVVKLKATDEDMEVEHVELLIAKDNNRLVAMFIYMPGQGRVEVELDGYAPRCGAADDVYECPEGEFPTAEIIDMR